MIPFFTGPDVELNRRLLYPMQKHFSLLTRLWVYQERLLSPHVVHFCAQELVWECMEEYNCECQLWPSYNPEYPKIKFSKALNTLSPLDLIRTWKDVVMEYTNLGLLFSSGRLPAIAGIAKYMEPSIKGSYLAGLWEDCLVDSLLRIIPKDRQSHIERALKERTPTWSWSSIEGPIMYPPDGAISIFSHQYAKVEGVYYANPGNDHYMSASLAFIIATAPAVPARLRYTPDILEPARCSHILLDIGENCVIEQDFRADYDSSDRDSSNHIADGLYFSPDYDFSNRGLTVYRGRHYAPLSANVASYIH